MQKRIENTPNKPNLEMLKIQASSHFECFSAYSCFILKITINHADIRYQHAKTKQKDSIKAKFGDVENLSI